MRPEILFPLFARTDTLKGVGPRLAALIAKVAGPQVIDLCWALPAGLIDRSARPSVQEAVDGAVGTFDIVVERHDPPPNRRSPYRVRCQHESGFLTLVFFRHKEAYLREALPEGARRIVSGKAERFQGTLQMTHPDYISDPAAPEPFPDMEPIYPLTAGLTQKTMAKAARGAVALAPELEEWIDGSLRAREGWPAWREALRRAHAPETPADLKPEAPARARLAFDELLANQLALALVRRQRTRLRGRAFPLDRSLRARAEAALPFQLTAAQHSALAEIDGDMAADRRMVRLLQGDVGSGKTVVALLAALTAIGAGAQAALMAPTEILARQHFEGLEPICETLGVTLALLTGRDKGAARGEKLAALASGETRLLIGTHALFQGDVAFADLGLAIVDEQHRFGVHQRLALSEKGARADLLVMTATPIPRSLALTAYGDMDVSQIREKPPGRKAVDTRALPLSRLDEVAEGVRRAAARGEQIYWVCPLVEESDVSPLTAAEDRAASLAELMPGQVGLVHGRMAAAEKDAAMEAFLARKLSVLVATTVIEVGVNAPNASIMVIEHAENFGLAQLHQLRGRVGRGERASSCLLLYKPNIGDTAKARLRILRETEDGFRIAEEDLRLRGAGELLGVQQSGLAQFRLADLPAHDGLLAMAGDHAKLILTRTPDLA
ncbi:MAG: ATP-dependent DNA helicase RecG, partial [Pseudomonadota bacterium]